MMWKYNGNILEKHPSDAIGFVYQISFPDGKKYIGKKSLFSRRKRNFGKKELALITDKRLKKYEIVIKQSNWRDYNSSNKDVVSRIKKGDEHIKTILCFARTKKHLTYLEEYMLFREDILFDDNFYNDNIAGKFFTKEALEWAQTKK